MSAATARGLQLNLPLRHGPEASMERFKLRDRAKKTPIVRGMFPWSD